MWELLKTLFRICDAKSRIQEIDGETDLQAISDKFNEFFTNIGPTLAEKIPNSVLDVDYYVCVDKQFNFSPVSEKEIFDLLKQMSCAKATGADIISVKLNCLSTQT